MLDLSGISYVGVEGRDGARNRADLMCRIGDRTAELINFAEIVLLTATPPSFTPRYVKVVHVPPMTYDEYNHFVFHRLHTYVTSDRMITFQDDGFAIAPQHWTSDFLAYDYVGAPWPLDCGWSWPGREIGNGGFSLRTRRLFEECERLPMLHGSNEDNVICLQYRDHLAQRGIRFATLEQGYRFSVENPFDDNHRLERTFGFHGIQHVAQAKTLLFGTA